MAFLETPLFIICISCGILFVIAGVIQWYFRPKKINYLYGYRTKLSMQSQEHWDFAQAYSAKEMMKLGVLLAILPFFSLFIEIESFTGMWIGLGLLISVCILLIIRTEKALRQYFKS